MSEFIYKYLHRISKKHGLTRKELEGMNNRLPMYAKAIKEKNLGFYNSFEDKETLKDILDFARFAKGKYDDIIVLGIGGSALSAICLNRALGHLYNNGIKKPKSPRLRVLDNIDPRFISQLEDVIDIKRTLFLVISKSGKTPETISQYFYFRNKCEQKKLNIKDHFVFITRPDKGFLRETSKEEGVRVFYVPNNVGGRFSVFTPVGLLPAALTGVDIKKLLSGARSIADGFLQDNPKGNAAFLLAVIQYLLYKKGKKIHVMMPYSQNLTGLSEWYTQLIAESTGKAKNNKGKTVNIGITPVKAVGATDQHAQCQLFNEGPNDKLIMFIKVEDFGPNVSFPHPYPKHKDVGYLKNISFNKLIHTELEGTFESLIKNDRPCILFNLTEINEETIGWLLMLFACSTAYLGEFFDINVFDQPGVELSKKITKKLLKK